MASMWAPCLSYDTSVLQRLPLWDTGQSVEGISLYCFFTTAGESAATSIDILIKIQKKRESQFPLKL